MPRLVVLDGHDAAGKSTLAGLIARHYGWRHVRPFAGELGDFIAWSYRSRRYRLANEVALGAVARVLDENRDAPGLVFDRHWLCMFTVLPPGFRRAWRDRPPTILIWADPETTAIRQRERSEPVDEALNDYYCRVYRELADRYRVPVVDTSRASLQDSLAECLALIEGGLLGGDRGGV
jgi:hypothetical protein